MGWFSDATAPGIAINIGTINHSKSIVNRFRYSPPPSALIFSTARRAASDIDTVRSQ